jgi:hypothetical protein
MTTMTADQFNETSVQARDSRILREVREFIGNLIEPTEALARELSEVTALATLLVAAIEIDEQQGRMKPCGALGFYGRDWQELALPTLRRLLIILNGGTLQAGDSDLSSDASGIALELRRAIHDEHFPETAA